MMTPPSRPKPLTKPAPKPTPASTSKSAPTPRRPQKIELARDELDFTYARSSGAGGQNVNKVNSKAILRWNPQTSKAMSEPQRARFLEKYSNKLTSDGELLLMSDVHRDQGRNTAECLERLREMIQSIAVPPKKRHATKPTYGSKVRRLKGKKEHSEKKKNRKVRADD